MVISSDFSEGLLDPVWSIEGPSGVSASLNNDATDAFLELTTPDGNYDVWGTNNGARAMQTAVDEDFQIEARFLSTPSEQYQMQGLLVEADADNWIRFDTYSTGSTYKIFASVNSAGSPSVQFNITLPAGSTPFLRVTRVGDTWTLEHSSDGSSWATAGSFTHALNVTAVGVFSGNTGAATGFTAQVDYFEISSDPILDEDGAYAPVNLAPEANDDALTTDLDTALDINITADLLDNDSDANGDSLSLSGFTQPTNGTLVDNGDGTLSYMPNSGFEGDDSFTYTVFDGDLSDTATTTISVTSVPPTIVQSDDFATGVLDPIWNIEGPAGISASLGNDAIDAFLELTTPDGNYDAWGTNNGARAMQDAVDEDFQIETRFLSTPTDKYQIQGLLVEGDADNWVRFDTYSRGNQYKIFAAVTVDGSSASKFNITLPDGSAPFLRVTRVGDTWTLEHSSDGSSWTVAGSFTHALEVTSVGVFAGNTGQATGFTAQVDYFEVSSDPILDEDGAYAPVNLAPEATDDGLTTDLDTALDINIAADLLDNDSDANGDNLSLTGFTQPANGTLVDNGDGTLSYTPNIGFEGNDSFTYTVFDGELSDTATVVIAVEEYIPPELVEATSDDFSAGVLDPVWTIEGPAGISTAFGTEGTDAYLELTTPDGNYDAWGTNNGARAMQDVSNQDFQLETRFLSTPTDKYQIQGLLVEADADNWIRFDTYSTGSQYRIFAATITGGEPSAQFNIALPAGSAPYLRVTRSGDTWTLEHSSDGASWSIAGSFVQALDVTSAGVFAGNTGAATGFTAQVDYFENTADPIVNEDGVLDPTNQAPIAGDDGLSTPNETALDIDIAADLLNNDSDPDGDPFTFTGFTQPANGTLVDNGDGTLSYTPDNGFEGDDSFTYTISDGGLIDTASVVITVSPDGPAEVISDDFSALTLGSAWTIEGPAGISTALGTSATDAYLELTTPDGGYDAWGTNNAARAMQESEDEDFQLETRFLSTPTERYQIQGLLIEADADNWIRFDTYSTGSRYKIFAAVTTGGSSSGQFNIDLPSGSAPYLRTTRAGDDWTMEYSIDGISWTVAGTFTHALAVTSVGVFSGNTDASSGFTARVDYFENTANPLISEDGDFVPANEAPVGVDDAFSTDIDNALNINVLSELLDNDTDANGDSLSLTGFTQPANGTLADNGDGTLTYTPDSGYEGDDSFTYTVFDGELSDTATVTISVTPPPVPAISDDFSGGGLDPAWTFLGVDGFAQVATTQTEAFVEIHAPYAAVVSASDYLTAPRLMQDVVNDDFQINAGFLTTPSEKYQEHGLLVVQDVENFIRFDMAYTGGTLTLIVGIITNGSTNYAVFDSVALGVVTDFQITRSGDDWVFETSNDGSTWTEAYTMNHAMTVTQVGVFAGSANFTGPAPGYIAKLDYFENTAAPIVDEDSTIVPVNVAPIVEDEALATPVETSLDIDVSDLLLNDIDGNEDVLSITGFLQPDNGTVIDNGDGTWTYTPDAGFEGEDAIIYTVSDGSLSTDGTLDMIVGDPIRVWYGDTQEFGAPGEGQVWANILGNVYGDIDTLTYTLNGGASHTLSVGPDTRRLQENGEFNIDLAIADLDGSAVDDVVTITSTLTDGSVYTKDVTIEYESGNSWDKNYSIDWDTVTDIRDVVQIVDGTWAKDGDGIRPVDLGYDRLLVIGDQSWDNYELNLTITMNDLQNTDPNGRDGGAFAFGLLWNGHTDAPIANLQPKSGWEPGASFFLDQNGSLTSHSYHSFSEHLDSGTYALQEGLTYNFTVRVEQVGIYDRVYSLKYWEVGTAEPVNWSVQGTETFDISEAPATGSIYLNSHYFDVTYNDLSVTEITGSDILQGTSGSDVLFGAETGGVGEVDVMVGNGGGDTFVFGDGAQVFYDDGNTGDAGEADYGFIWDFNGATDVIQLHGTSADYYLAPTTGGMPTGTAIYLTKSGGEPDELIGVINAVSGLDLTSDDFIYTDSGSLFA